ncbi:VOC family protein [Rhodococcoides fascians]|uniref:VOC family protein n=1 Tax=Rhodococcoides fascians TaxID=1828 RepID=UPI002ACE02CC|nr:VOC family protein [Rhodococcus fascians]WQH28812.1 VOC family protein [Rhodococcus fascians]
MALLTDEQIHQQKIVQVAFVVDDLEKAALHWAQTHGAGPFFFLDEVPLTDVRGPDGEPGVLQQGFAVGQWGPVMVELNRQDRIEPAAAGDILMAPGFSHIAYFSTDSEAEEQRLVEAGAPLLMSLSFGETRVRFHDARSTSGYVIEHYACAGAVEETYRRVAEAAEGWDGTDPFRAL